ncbi:hypothetical protein MFRU_004g04390 [Monilinia fructicola]|nr:hypothetical protein MFRU_004g04390 [Monilinia fructicola]
MILPHLTSSSVFLAFLVLSLLASAHAYNKAPTQNSNSSQITLTYTSRTAIMTGIVDMSTKALYLMLLGAFNAD